MIFDELLAAGERLIKNGEETFCPLASNAKTHSLQALVESISGANAKYYDSQEIEKIKMLFPQDSLAIKESLVLLMFQLREKYNILCLANRNLLLNVDMQLKYDPLFLAVECIVSILLNKKLLVQSRSIQDKKSQKIHLLPDELMTDSKLFNESEELSQHLEKYAEEAIIETSEKGKISRFNNAAEAMFYVEANSAQGECISRFIPGYDDFEFENRNVNYNHKDLASYSILSGQQSTKTHNILHCVTMEKAFRVKFAVLSMSKAENHSEPICSAIKVISL